MLAKVSRSGQGVSKKHLAGYYPSNVTMKGKLFKKRKVGGSAWGSMGDVVWTSGSCVFL